MLKELSGCQLELRDLLWKANKSHKKDQTNILATVEKVMTKITTLKNKIPLSKISNSDIISSLEYQKCLSTKFSQLLVSIYTSDPSVISELLKIYPLEEIIYDLFVNYILKDSQTSNQK